MSTQLRADAQRNLERVLDAAAELFAERGCDVSVDEIARKAGVGHATVFRRFPSKDALISAVVSKQIHELTGFVEGALAEEDASHAAAADLANDAERANAIGGRAGRLEERRRECGGGSFEGAIRPVGSQEREDFRAECFVTSTLARDDRRLLIGGKVDGSVEYGIDAAEPIGR